MAEIKLTREAAQSVSQQLEESAIGISTAKFDYPTPESQSEMMSKFIKRTEEVRKLMLEYQELITRDVASLRSACEALSSADAKESSRYSSGSSAGGFSDAGGGSR